MTPPRNRHGGQARTPSSLQLELRKIAVVEQKSLLASEQCQLEDTLRKVIELGIVEEDERRGVLLAAVVEDLCQKINEEKEKNARLRNMTPQVCIICHMCVWTQIPLYLVLYIVCVWYCFWSRKWSRK
jgi:hypothetical protein